MASNEGEAAEQRAMALYKASERALFLSVVLPYAGSECNQASDEGSPR